MEGPTYCIYVQYTGAQKIKLKKFGFLARSLKFNHSTLFVYTYVPVMLVSGLIAIKGNQPQITYTGCARY